ncbi:MAG: hypothetical protein IJZ49_03545 [Alistipes sp.]|nr:hypothetical protein [Alistipes sp.]
MLSICLVIACDKGEQSVSIIDGDSLVEVVISTAEPTSESATRTQLLDSGEVRWSAGDIIRVWAKATNSNDYALAGQDFKFAGYNATYNSADFKTTLLANQMPDGNYKYGAVYPTPKSQNGVRVTYSLPSVQYGTYDPKLDVMTAQADGRALHTADATPDVIEWNEMPQPKLSFSHMFHLIRIRVPESKNLLGDPIKQLDIIFPYPVVGDVEFDATYPNNPASQKTYPNTSNKITVILPDNELLDANGRYVWLHIFPPLRAMTQNDELRIRALSKSGVISQEIKTSLNGKTFLGGHITPIALTIPQSDENAYKEITFSCPDNSSYPNFLGENATTMYVREWPAAFKPIKSQSATISSSGNGEFKVKFYYLNNEDYQFNTTSNGAQMTVAFDSANASVNHNNFTTTLPDFVSDTPAYYALPYLFFEDFVNTTKSFEYKSEHTGSDATEASSKMLNGEDSYLVGWSGGRVGLAAGKSLRIYSRAETGFWVVNRNTGRVDSKKMSRLNDNSTVVSTVVFDYSGGAYSGVNSDLGNPLITFGYTNISGSEETAIKVTDNISNIIIDSKSIENDYIGENAIYDVKHTFEYCKIANCSNKTRLSWSLSNSHGSQFGGNGSYWFYIDNIKVSIGGSVKHAGLEYRNFFPNHTN